MRTRRSLALIAAALALAVAACGDSGTSQDTTGVTEPAGGSTAWVGELDGAPSRVEFDVAPEDPGLQAAERYRSLVNGQPVEYVRVTVDNSAGDADVAPAYADINGGDGTDQALVLDFACAWVRTWWEISSSLSEEDAEQAFAAQQEAIEALDCSGGNAVPAGQTGAYYLVKSADNPEIESLSIRFNEFTQG